MGHSVQENQFAEVLVYRDEDPILRFRWFQQGFVAGIRTQGQGFKHIMSRVVEPFCQSVSSASVNQKPHASATETASSLSLAMTAWA